MHEIEMHNPSEEFAHCWSAAGNHLSASTHDGGISWLKNKLEPPFLEHLSFRLGNQLFFIRIEDVDGRIRAPGNSKGFRMIAKKCNGVACRMPMRRINSEWKAEYPGWGLIHADTGQPINPITMITDEKIEMTDWEVHDFAVQVVRNYIVKNLAHKFFTSQSNPTVDPSIWFEGKQGREWVVVRVVRYPDNEAPFPKNMAEIAANCAKNSTVGHFASVAIANADDPFSASSKLSPMPLWRGHAMYVRLDGLVPVKTE